MAGLWWRRLGRSWCQLDPALTSSPTWLRWTFGWCSRMATCGGWSQERGSEELKASQPRSDWPVVPSTGDGAMEVPRVRQVTPQYRRNMAAATLAAEEWRTLESIGRFRSYPA